VNDLPAAIRQAKRALEARPTDVDVVWMLGVAHARLEQFDEMEQAARRVAVLRGDPSQWYQVVREFNGQFEK